MEWDNDMIVVLKDVRISPPYTPENCEGSQGACERIKKQVWIHHNPIYTACNHTLLGLECYLAISLCTCCSTIIFFHYFSE